MDPPTSSFCDDFFVPLSDYSSAISEGHVETLDLLLSEMKEEKKKVEQLHHQDQELERELDYWKEHCMELQDELLEWKATHKNRFSIHSLKDSASKLSSLLGVPSYEEFTEFVDEVYWAGNLGWGELDRYDQVAAALIHLRTGSTWVFLSLLFFSSAKKEPNLCRIGIRALSYIERDLYTKHVFYPPPAAITEKTPCELLADLPGCYAFVDGTYLYGENSQSASLHQEMYCHYKNSLQLTKFLVVCDPVGFIMGIYGPCSSTSDDVLFKNIVTHAKEISEGERDDDDLGCGKMLWSWLSSLPQGASLVFDAGFPSIEKVLPVNVVLPTKPRKGEEVFEASDAVKSRKVTKWRGVIERVNRRLKVFRLLSVRFPNSSLINCELFFRVSAILGNRFGQTLTKLAEDEDKTFKKYFEE